MLTFLLSQNGSSRFPHGVYATLRAESDTPGNTYQYTVYSIEEDKYLEESDGQFTFTSNTPYAWPTVLHTLPDGTEIHTIQINTSSLASDSLLSVSVSGTNGDATTYVRYVEVGDFVISDDNVTVEVYGFFRDAYGEPVRNAAVSFTVMNKTTYFDNSPATSLHATAVTDNSGKFSIHLNRNYDYTLSIASLNYLKVVKLSELPNSVSVVEVDLGTGLGC